MCPWVHLWDDWQGFTKDQFRIHKSV